MEDGVFVTNICAAIDEKELRSFFAQYGIVSDLNFQPDKFNESNKICYMKFSSPEGASNFVKKADRSTHFGEPLKVAFKKFTERNTTKVNAVSRMQSFVQVRSPGTPCLVGDFVRLKNIVLPLEKKLVVEIIELSSLKNIMARPLQLTEKYRSNLSAMLEKINENADLLTSAKNVEVNGFYLAKWMEDNKFYRAKILNKIPDDKYEVSFVDEGTTGDVVTELKVIPDNLLDIPCQFLPCAINCNDSPELIDLVLKEGSDSEISIYATSSAMDNDKDVINIFIDDKDITEIYKTKYNTDPRIDKMPSKNDLVTHKLDQPLLNCQLIKNHKLAGHVTVIIKEATTINGKLQSLITSPIPNDIVIYKDNSGNLHRSVINSYKFANDRLNFFLSFLDEDGLVSTTKENIMRCSPNDIKFPPKVIKGVLSGDYNNSSLYEGIKTVILSDYDRKKELYVVNIEAKKTNAVTEGKDVMEIRERMDVMEIREAKDVKEGKVLTNGMAIVGQIKSVLISHVESSNEFYVQFGDESSALTLDKIQGDINSAAYRLIKFEHVRDLKINQVVIAPFQSVNYRATVRSTDWAQNTALLYFMDFGNSESIVGTEIAKAHDNVAHIDPLAHRCRLAVTVNDDEGVTGAGPSVAGQLLWDYCDWGETVVHMKIIEVEESVLCVSVTANNKSTFAELLLLKGVVAGHKPPAQVTDAKAVLRRAIANLEERIAKLEAFVLRR